MNARRACAALLLALLSSCAAPDAPLAGYDLVIVNVDSLRADHLGFHGYARDTSPFLDSLSARAVVFEQALSASSITRESVAALLTGCLPSRCGASGWHAAPRSGVPHLGERLRAAGYRTAFLSNTVMLRDPGFSRGFERVQHLPKAWDISGAGEELSRSALEFVREAGGARFAMYLHYLDPHAPYEPPARLLRRLGAPPHERPLSLYRDVMPRLSELRRAGFGPGHADFEDLVWRYDAEIASTDAALQVLVRGLSELGALERTLLVVTADHGEEFLDHGWFEHGWTLYQESIHVPLLFFAPAALAPERVPERVSQVDVAPSLDALLGLPGGGAASDGESLFMIRGGSATPRARSRSQVAELLIPRRNVLWAWIEGPWKYVAAQRWLPPEEREAPPDPPALLTPDAPVVRETLVDLADDPGERGDPAAEPNDRLDALRRRLAAHRERSLSVPAEAPAPGSPRVEPEEAERLRSLGYH